MAYYYLIFFGLLFMSIFTTLKCSSEKPHIIFILADDLGWNDVGFHGSAQIPTPNLDLLAYSGIILNRYYVTPICTPSRSALMTGKYPIHTGMQHTVLFGAEPRGLPLHEKLLPQYLKDLGYSNHIVGKWHLGHYKRVYTPLYRGFDSHTGFWTGHQDYFDHTAVESPSWGLDIRRGLNVAYDLHGKYITNVIKQESVDVIKAHNASAPLFLYVAHAAVHSGNPYNPLPAPDEAVDKMSHIENYNRRKFAAMLSVMDDSVGAIVDALEKQNMLENSIIIFSTDNGGPAEGFNMNAASNWPLRGVKNTLWEGGVRGAGFIWSPLLKDKERVSEQIFHISDWLPTLYEAAGGNLRDLPKDIDGLSFWSELNHNNGSKRHEILHNIDDIYGSASLTVGTWKLHKGTNYNGQWDSWYGPEGLKNPDDYNIKALFESPTGVSLSKISNLPSVSKIIELRKNATIECTNTSSSCLPLEAPCLFNIIIDPCEQNNLAEHHPEILNFMIEKLAKYNETAIPPGNKNMDPRADPKFWDYTWTNFGDYSQFIIIT